MLLDKQYEPDEDKRIDKAFRHMGDDPKDEERFDSYVRGGVDVLYVAKMAKSKGLLWEDIVEKLNKISWSFDNELWINLLVIGSTNKKMITGKEAVRGVGMVISYLVMGDKMTKAELADVKTVYTNAKNNPDEPLPARV